MPRARTPRADLRRPLAAVPLMFVALGSLVLGFGLGCGAGKPAGSEQAPGGSTGTAGGSSSATSPPDTTPETTPPAGTGGAVAALGPKVFAVRCALCHGPDGHGDGPGSAALNPKPRNFHDQAYMKTRTDAQLLEIIRNGKGVMPKWGGILSEAEMQAVLAHVRELAGKP